MLHLPESINKAIVKYVLYLLLFDCLNSIMPYLCALSFKLAGLQDKLCSIALTLCLVACSFVYCALIGCLGLTELVEEREDHSLSWEQWSL